MSAARGEPVMWAVGALAVAGTGLLAWLRQKRVRESEVLDRDDTVTVFGDVVGCLARSAPKYRDETAMKLQMLTGGRPLDQQQQMYFARMLGHCFEELLSKTEAAVLAEYDLDASELQQAVEYLEARHDTEIMVLIRQLSNVAKMFGVHIPVAVANLSLEDARIFLQKYFAITERVHEEALNGVDIRPLMSAGPEGFQRAIADAVTTTMMNSALMRALAQEYNLTDAEGVQDAAQQYMANEDAEIQRLSAAFAQNLEDVQKKWLANHNLTMA